MSKEQLKKTAANNHMFKIYRDSCLKHFDWVPSGDDYKQFIDYCVEGRMVNDVKPIFNVINLYAFSCGYTSKEANEKLFERLKK